MQMNVNYFHYLDEIMSSKTAVTESIKYVFAVVLCVCMCTLLYFGMGILKCEMCCYHENSKK